MAMRVDAVSVACDTSTASQAITVDLGGDLPVVAFFLVTATTADGDSSSTDNAVMSFGATDGTNQWAIGYSSEHNASSTTDTYTWFVTDECILILNPADGTVDGEANIVSFAANTINVNWGNLPGSAWKLTVWAIGGGEISAVVGNATLDQDVNAEKSIAHGLGRLPAWVVGASCGTHATADTGAAADMGRITVGFSSYDGAAIKNVCQGHQIRDGAGADYQVSALAYRDRLFKVPYYAGSPISAAVQAACQVSSYSSTSIGLTKRDSSLNADFGYAIVTGGHAYASMWGEHESTAGFPTGTGVKTHDPVPGTQFLPLGAMLGLTRLNYSEVDSVVTNVRAGTMGIGFVGPQSGHCASVQHQRNEIATDTQSIYNDKPIHLPAHSGGTGGHEAEFSSYAQTSVAVNVTTAVSSTKCIPTLLIGRRVPRGDPRGRITSSGVEAGRVSGTMTVIGHIRTNAVVAGRVVAASVLIGRIVAFQPAAGRVVAGATLRGIIISTGSEAGRITHSAVTAGRVGSSGVEAGRVTGSSTARGLIVHSGAEAGSVTSNA